MRLLRRADFHVGAHVNTFWRTPCRGAAEGPSKKSVVWENKHITWFGECQGGGGGPARQVSWLTTVPPTATLDGGIGLLLPMQEKTYRRLLMLQNALTTMLPHHAGLNPRAFRCVRCSPPGLCWGPARVHCPTASLPSQDAARGPAHPAECREKRPGRGAAQPLPVPEHHGAGRAGQEDWHHARHRE